MALSCCKELSALLRGITSNHKGHLYCLNCLHLYRTENKLKKHYNVFKNHYCCYLEMPKKNDNILKYNHGEKSLKVRFIIYTNLEPLLEEMSTCHNNPKNSSTTKIIKHRASGYSLFTNCSFDAAKNNFDCYKGKDCMKNFFIDLREHATKIINYKKKEMIPLRNKKNYIVS